MEVNSDKIIEQIKKEEILMLQGYAEELSEVTEAAMKEAQAGNWPEAFKMLWLVATSPLKHEVRSTDNSPSKK